MFQGLRNDFQEAMEKVDEAYLNEILALGTQVCSVVFYYFSTIINIIPSDSKLNVSVIYLMHIFNLVVSP